MISMEGGQYAALAHYLKKGVYPNGFSKGQKYSLRRAALKKCKKCITDLCI